jgi:hypothetical protein
MLERYSDVGLNKFVWLFFILPSSRREKGRGKSLRKRVKVAAAEAGEVVPWYWVLE